MEWYLIYQPELVPKNIISPAISNWPLMLCCHLQHQNDTIIKDERRLLYKYMYPSLYCKGSKRVIQGLRVRGSWRPNRTAIYFDPHSYGRHRCVFLVLQGCSIGGPEAHSAGWWLSLLHLNNFSGPQLNRGPQWPLRPDVAFLTTLVYNSVRSLTEASILTELYNSPRPLSHLLDFWNRMLDHHQAEITVMQFTGHSVPVHQSMSVPWEFFYLVPFHQPISAHTISSHNCH